MDAVFRAAMVLLFCCALAAAQEGFVQLFNGKDLSGWQSIKGQQSAEAGAFSGHHGEHAIHVYAGEKAGSKVSIVCLPKSKTAITF